MWKKGNEWLKEHDFARMFLWGNTYPFIYALAQFFGGNWWGWKEYMLIWAIINGLLCLFVVIKYYIRQKDKNQNLPDSNIKKLTIKRVGIYALAAMCTFGVFWGMEQVYMRKQINKAVTFADPSKCSISIQVDDGSEKAGKEIKLSAEQKEEFLTSLKKDCLSKNGAKFATALEEDQPGEQLSKENKCYCIDIGQGEKWKELYIYETWDGNWLFDSMGRIGIGDMNETKAYVTNLFQENSLK